MTFTVHHDYGLGPSVTYVEAADEADCRAKCEPFTRIARIECRF